jgi:lon-related putative ATP-dependent protease
MDAGAVAAVIERAARMTGDADRLSTHMRRVTDLLREADDRAGAVGRDGVNRQDVRDAIEASRRRASRISERTLEQIERGTVLVATAGEAIGQVNGLSVMTLGEASFGRPTRITASVRLGEGDIVDIEREVKLGGPIHSKGVLILAGLLGARYGRTRPLSLHASLVFEQSYGGVEGDSASLAEACALLSAIGEIPLRQSLALTGSLNQRGEVQPIGGVNEKIEGFFDVCAARGLDGSHAVAIPATNLPHLMLRDDVVEAVRDGRFAVYAVRTIDDAMALLTGLEPAVVDKRVAAGLDALTDRAVQLAARARAGGEDGRRPKGRRKSSAT